MLRRTLALTALALGVLAPAAGAATSLNVVPHGNRAPGVPWGATPGMLPADTQAKMYDRITPLFRGITDSVLTPSADGSGYFKNGAILPQSDPSFIFSETISGTSPTAGPVSATIKRDAYGVPFIFSDTDAGAIFGAGYVAAIDQGLLLNQARFNGVAALADLPGVSAISLVLGLYSYTPSKKVVDEATRLQTKNIEAQGEQGRQLLRDIDTYLAGINKRVGESSPGTPKYTRTDIYALNAIKAQFLGEGGGNEISNAQFLDALRSKFGAKKGDGAFKDLQARNDPEASVTTAAKSFDAQTNVSVAKPAGLVRLKNRSFRDTYVKLPGASASSAAASGATRPGGARREASNILIVSGARSATGAPLFVGGPQIGYNYPGLTYEAQISSPNISVRGAMSAPYPGYMLIGHTNDYAWSLTSAGADIVDIYAETLCGGSKHKYLFKGRCRAMEKVSGGTIAKGAKKTTVSFYRTVHGPVLGYAKDAATKKTVALTRKRASYGKESVDLLFNQQMTFGRVKSARDFINAAKKTPQTFNSFYASATESGFYTSGQIPLRKAGVNPTLPVKGTGSYEWQGTLPTSKHPQVINPASGLIVNWNNKPGRNFPAGDDRFGNEGGLQRNLLLTSELERYPKATLANVLAAENAGATMDVRVSQFWPTLKRVLDKSAAPDPLSQQMADVLQQWHEQGASRVDADLNGVIDSPGAPVIDAIWKGVTDAGMCRRLGSSLCSELEQRISRYDSPPGGQYSGWHQYLWKDLRALLGDKVQGRYSLRYCGGGDLTTCSKDLWAAISAAGKKVAASQGANPTAWTAPVPKVGFSPIPLYDMQYTNKPSGIQQVITYGP